MTPNGTRQRMFPFFDEYRQAARTELETLEGVRAWDVFDCEDEIIVIISKLDFKLKQHPNGLIKKFKARLCACGDMQLKGIYLFETYSYPDTYFSIMYGHENPTDTDCVKSCTGYVITFSDCHVLWKSKLQTYTYLFIMEAGILL